MLELQHGTWDSLFGRRLAMPKLDRWASARSSPVGRRRPGWNSRTGMIDEKDPGSIRQPPMHLHAVMVHRRRPVSAEERQPLSRSRLFAFVAIVTGAYDKPRISRLSRRRPKVPVAKLGWRFVAGHAIAKSRRATASTTDPTIERRKKRLRRMRVCR
jgi:hypothetical protein